MVNNSVGWLHSSRLKELEQAMVGGEAADNEQVKERRRKKKKYAEEHKKRLQGNYGLTNHK
jgi:kinesin family protein 3/17